MKKKPKKSEQLQALAMHTLPAPLQEKLEAVRSAINELKDEARENWQVTREFSPDGRFLGDVGELIAKLFYGVKLTTKQEKGHDALDAEYDAVTQHGGKKVEVKLRSRSTNIHFTAPAADFVLVLYVCPTTLKWGEVCNGPGKELLEDAQILSDGKLSTDCYKLLTKQRNLSSSALSLRRINPLS